MNIIIVGNGKVGFALAQELSKMKHNITVIDTNMRALDDLSNRLDVNWICGSGMSMEILTEANAATSDLIIAATGNDELNIVVCIVASRMGTKNTVARIRNPEYTGELELLKNGLGISRIINPELEAAVEISRLLTLPVADRVDTFANDRVELVEYTLEKNDSVIGKSLDSISLPSGIIICGAEKETLDGDFMIADGRYVFEENDTIYVAGSLFSINSFFKFIGHTSHKTKEIMIIGGSRMAVYLARLARKTGVNVRLIEQNEDRAEQLSKLLDDCIIIHGDGTDEEVLLSEDLKKMDAFIALTDNDEENLISAYFAKKQGVLKVIPKINRQNYVELVRDWDIESTVCPKLVTANHMYRYVTALSSRKSEAMRKLYRIANDKAEAVEFIASPGSRVLNTPLMELNINKNILVAAIVRGKEVAIPNGKSVIRKNDQVLIFSKKLKLDELDDILSK